MNPGSTSCHIARLLILSASLLRQQRTWDSCFMSQFSKFAPEEFPGIESLDNFYAVQRKDGYIPRCFNLTEGKIPDFAGVRDNINPPLAAWSEYDYVRQTGNVERVKHVLPHLIRLDRWIETNRRRKDGTYWFSDGAAAGMDNSPRTARRNKFGNDVGWIDLASQQALAAESIAKLAAILDDTSTESEFNGKYAERVVFINDRHWCEKEGFYLDLLLQGLDAEDYLAYYSSVKTVASFWPMLAGACDPSKRKRLVEHLRNPNEFNRPHPVPSLSYDSPAYSADGMYWQGGVWAPTNYMVVRGLLRCGEYALARDIAWKHIRMMNEVYREFEPHSIWEAYSPEKNMPSLVYKSERYSGRALGYRLVRDRFCGWSALGPTAMMIEAIVGIETDYLNRTIHWHSDCMEEHGVRNLQYGPYKIHLIAKAGRNKMDIPEIVVESPVAVKVDFRRF